MSNNVDAKDAAGASKTFKTTDNASVHTPHTNVDAIAAGDNNIGNVDVVSLPALAAGSAAIGKLAANSGVDIGDVDVTSIAAGNNNIGDVDIASIAAGDNNIGNVDIVTLPALVAGSAAIGKLAANSGVDIGDVDILSIAAGNNNIGDVDVASIAAGDNNIGNVDVVTLPALPAGTNAIGGTKDNGPHWTTVLGVSSAVVTSADSQTPTAITAAPTGGQKIVVTDIIASTDTTMWLEFEEETSATILFKVYLPANGTVQITPRGKVKLATADKKLMVDASVAGNIAVTALYYSEA